MTLVSQADPYWATSWTAKDHETSFHFAFAPEASVHRRWADKKGNHRRLLALELNMLFKGQTDVITKLACRFFFPLCESWCRKLCFFESCMKELETVERVLKVGVRF